MAIEKQIIIDKIEVLEQGQIQIRQKTNIIENGNIISSAFHRKVITPDLGDLSFEDPKVQAIANAIWTDEVKYNYKQFVRNNAVDAASMETA